MWILFIKGIFKTLLLVAKVLVHRDFLLLFARCGWLICRVFLRRVFLIYTVLWHLIWKFRGQLKLAFVNVSNTCGDLNALDAVAEHELSLILGENLIITHLVYWGMKVSISTLIMMIVQVSLTASVGLLLGWDLTCRTFVLHDFRRLQIKCVSDLLKIILVIFLLHDALHSVYMVLILRDW